MRKIIHRGCKGSFIQIEKIAGQIEESLCDMADFSLPLLLGAAALGLVRQRCILDQKFNRKGNLKIAPNWQVTHESPSSGAVVGWVSLCRKLPRKS
jgi:hypothetical protein